MNVSVGRLKKDLSALLNQVAYGHERVVIESRGRPKAVLVSLEELERLDSHALSRGDRSAEGDSLLRQLGALRSKQTDSCPVGDLRALREGRLADLGGR